MVGGKYEPAGELPQPTHRVFRRTGRERGTLVWALFCLPHALAGILVLLAVLAQLDLLLFGTDIAGRNLSAKQEVSGRGRSR